MTHNLKALRDARKWTQQEAAAALGIGYKGYIKIEHSERSLKMELARKAAGVYNCSVSYVLGLPETVPVVGYAGAGAEMHFYSAADTPWGEASMPPGGNDKTVAVQSPPDERAMRKMCVVGLSDGRVLIKILVPGTKKGHYHLLSPDSAVIEDVRVEWAAVVKAYAPH